MTIGRPGDLKRSLTLSGKDGWGTGWRSIGKDEQGRAYILDRTRRNVWEDSTADVGQLRAQGVGALGRLCFPSDEEQQQEVARFASLNVPGTDADCAVKLLLTYWRIEQPSVVLSVTGSAQAMDLEPRLEAFLEKGIFDAARSTRAWVITGGTDTGVMALAGKAIRARDTNIRTAESVKWTTPLIGIAPLHRVTGGDALSRTMPEDGAAPPKIPYRKDKKNSSASAALDFNHSHFILINNTENKGWGSEIEMRASIEKRLSEKLPSATKALPKLLKML